MYSAPSLQLRAQATLELRRRKAKSVEVLSFRHFIEIVNPHYNFYPHVDPLIAALQRVADGSLKRLMVFMPPRHGKSETASRLFPAYYLYRHPERWVGIVSYSADLAYGFSRNARSNYERAGRTLSDAAWAVKNWETGQGGGLWAAGVGGSVTGKGFDLGLMDDPIKGRKNADSDTIRKTAHDFYDADFYTRQEPGAAIVMIQTRWHDDDPSGRLLRQESDGDHAPEHWHIINMPAIKEPPPAFPATCTVEADNRTEGVALCPERYDVDVLARIKSRNPEEFASLYQQNPVTEGGNIFKAAFWDDKNRYGPEIRKVISRIISLDTALKDEETNDNTAWTVFDLLADYRVVVREIDQIKIESTDIPDLIVSLAEKWNYDDKLKAIVIEDKGSGTNATQTLRKTAKAWIANIVYAFMPNGTKQYRAKQAAIWCGRDMVLMPSIALGLEWLHGVLDPIDGELLRFPRTQHDDRTDSFSQGILYMENYLAAGFAARQQVAEAA